MVICHVLIIASVQVFVRNVEKLKQCIFTVECMVASVSSYLNNKKYGFLYCIFSSINSQSSKLWMSILCRNCPCEMAPLNYHGSEDKSVKWCEMIAAQVKICVGAIWNNVQRADRKCFTKTTQGHTPFWRRAYVSVALSASTNPFQRVRLRAVAFTCSQAPSRDLLHVSLGLSLRLWPYGFQSRVFFAMSLSLSIWPIYLRFFRRTVISSHASS